MFCNPCIVVVVKLQRVIDLLFQNFRLSSVKVQLQVYNVCLSTILTDIPPTDSQIDSEEGEEWPVTDDSEAAESCHSPVETQDSEDGADSESAVDSNVEEEQERADVMLTGQEDSEQECAYSTNGVEIEKEDEEGVEAAEGQTVTNAPCGEEREEAENIDIICSSDT